MYRTTAEQLLQTISEFRTSLRLFYQGIFLLGAFHVALHLQPMLSPPQEDRVEYTRENESGMKIDIGYSAVGKSSVSPHLSFRDLSFTYPGKSTPTLHDINFQVKPGEVVAIVGR